MVHGPGALRYLDISHNPGLTSTWGDVPWSSLTNLQHLVAIKTGLSGAGSGDAHAGLLPASRLAVCTCRPATAADHGAARGKPADPHRSPPCVPCRPGHLPTALGDLGSTLRSIKFGGSSWMPFSEAVPFPDSWGNLTGLEYLDLSYGSIYNFSGAQPGVGSSHGWPATAH